MEEHRPKKLLDQGCTNTTAGGTTCCWRSEPVTVLLFSLSHTLGEGKSFPSLSPQDCEFSLLLT